MHFDQQPVGARGHGSPGHGQHAVAASRSVAGVNQNGQMAHPLQRRNNAQVEGVACMVREGAYAALAQNHLVVALAHHVFGGHEELFEGGAEPALHQHRLAQLAGLFQQREVLHVARADLDHVGPFGHQFEGLVVERLGNDAQPETVADLGHDLQRIQAQALKCVG